MSTKIYIGQRALDRNPFVVMQRMKEVLEPIFFAYFDNCVDVADHSHGVPWTTAFDLPPRAFTRHAPGWDLPIQPERGNSTAPDVWRLMKAAQSFPSVNWSPIDFAYTVSLIPDGRGIEKRPLVLLFSEFGGQAYREALIDAGVVEEFGYWNNTDGPDSLSAYQWSQRRLAWDKLNVPSQDGLQLRHPSEVDTVYGLPYRRNPSLRGGR